MIKAISYLSKNDQKLKFILENFGEPLVQKREEGFESMCHIILEQQVSIASAKVCFVKLQTFFGEITPSKIIVATEFELKNCGLSRQKIVYLKDLASKMHNQQIDFASFKTKTEAQIRAELITIKGIGNWSVDVYLMFCMQHNDVFPLGDIAIKNTMTELYLTQTTEQMKTISDTWKPYRSYACFTIWHYYLKKRSKI